MYRYARHKEVEEELRSVSYLTFIAYLISALLLIMEHSFSNTLVSFLTLLELAILSFFYWGYISSLRKQNYGLWGVTFLIFLLFVKQLVFFSLIYKSSVAQTFILIGLIIFVVNSYVMSSPLYYSLVQWWEYDYKYRSDLKIVLISDAEEFEARLTDLRRKEASIECFDFFQRGQKLEVKLVFDEQTIQLPIEVRTIKELIKGRPLRYGVTFDGVGAEFVNFKKIWNSNRSAKLRSKFK